MYPEIVIFGHSYRSYILLNTLAIVIGMIGLIVTLKKLRYSLLELICILVFTPLTFLFGARLFNYAVNYSDYIEAGRWLFDWSFTGFSVYGGIIGILLTFTLLHLLFKKDYWLFYDQMIVPFTITFVMARSACFLNGCCHGHYTDLPWGVPLPAYEQHIRAFIIGKSNAALLRVHPTQIYEALGAIIVLFITLGVGKKYEIVGLKALLYGVLFTAMRFFVFYVRELPYDDWILSFGYPIFYLLIIGMGTWLLIRKVLKNRNSSL